ncbi:MAG: RsmE family RNA methyltransferase [Planctomycetota bacterium]
MPEERAQNDHFLFYTTEVSENRVVLDKGETRHLNSVLRIEEGDVICVTSGSGTVFRCRIESLGRNGCECVIVDRTPQPCPNAELDFYLGLPDKKPFERAIEMLIPLAVRSITPVVCEYCQNQWWSQRWENRRERFERKMVAAAKQSWNTHLPRLHEPVPFGAAMEGDGPLLYAHPRGDTMETWGGMINGADSCSCFVGPPGGFSPGELEAFRDAGAAAVWLSPHRLRTEHAAAAMAVVLRQATEQ